MEKPEATMLPMPKLCAIKGCDKFALKSGSTDAPEPDIADLASVALLEGVCITFCLFIARNAAVNCFSAETAAWHCEMVNCSIVLPF